MGKKLSEMHHSEVGYWRNPEPPGDVIDEEEVERYCSFDKGDQVFFRPDDVDDSVDPTLGTVIERVDPVSVRNLLDTWEVIGETAYGIKLTDGTEVWISADRLDLDWQPETAE